MDWTPNDYSANSAGYTPTPEYVNELLAKIKHDKQEPGETFEVKPHFEWVKFRRSVTQAAMLDDKLNMVVHDYQQWREGKIKSEVVDSATALFITGRANVDVRNIFKEANGNGKISYVEMCELRRRYIEDMYGVPVRWIPGHEPKEEAA